jgi:hypothetical protein
MSWLEQPGLCSVWEHRTVRWCTGQCLVRQAGLRELAALGNSPATYGYNSPDCPVCTGLSGEPTVGRAICAGHVAEPTARRGHRTVRCANGSLSANGRLHCKRKEIGHRTVSGVHRTVRCASRQKARSAFPDCSQTAPSCLGAIKGSPRRMEDNTKHSYNIPKHQDIDSAPLIHCVSI